MPLILIKHARPQVDPERPPHEWPLSEEGRAAAGRLAERLRGTGIARVYHSDEAKALETADVLAAALSVPVEYRDGLHEHDRSNVPHMRPNEYISHMELFFRRPGECVLGRESADACATRFAEAVGSIIAAHPAEAVAIVSHGTVIALFLAGLGAGRPFDLWRRMGLPSYAVVDLAGRRVAELVERDQP